ncbi:hypothetical protein FPOA_06418 [Fusarium poae]|uniref:Uncharacterized protein n=1 Tax=Fusarium poae TaxID=36050 RepID=A0A1B8AZI4_FUSPO|nr:hypothetical protein FPOA_06418 [Fusarium poae]
MSPGDVAKTRSNLPNPTDVLRAYLEPSTKEWVIKILKQLDQPTLIPVTRQDNQATTTSIANTSMDPVRFMLVHAMQVLMFVPMHRGSVNWTDNYTRRFPSQLAGGYQVTSILGRYSMEDLNRAIVSCFQFLTRRDGTRDVLSRVPGVRTNYKWYGYADPNFRIDEAAPEGVGRTIDTLSRANLEYRTAKRVRQQDMKERQRNLEATNENLVDYGHGAPAAQWR